jgi:hypothetical protein
MDGCYLTSSPPLLSQSASSSSGSQKQWLQIVRIIHVPLSVSCCNTKLMYSWIPWSASVTAPSAGDAQIICRALDSQHNRQPETLESVWNIRGLLNNAYHRVPLKVSGSK